MKEYLISRQKMVEDALQAYLPKPSVKPRTIHKAMRYSIFAGGKRLRPILCLAVAECCGGEAAAALPLARNAPIFGWRMPSWVRPPASLPFDLGHGNAKRSCVVTTP